MSSILKALKKLEEEKVARRGEPKDISRTILRERQGQKRFPWLPVIAGMILVASFAVLVTYAAMGGFSRPGDRGVRPIAQAPTVQQSEIPARAPASETPKIEEKQSVAAPPLVEKTPALPATAQKLPLAGVSQAKAAAQPPATPPATVTTEPPIQQLQENKREPETQSPPSLRVTGIAWQKDSASRIAIVNGQAVSEGASVGSARVQTILPDRLEFICAGQRLSVPLEK